MKNNFFSLSPQHSPEARRVFGVALIYFVVLIVINLFLPVYVLVGSNTNAFYLFLGIFSTSALLSLGLSWSNRARPAAWFLLGGLALEISFVVLNSSASGSGLAIISGIGNLALLISLAIIMKMSDQDIIRATLFSVIFTVAVILFDLFGPARTPLPESVTQYIPITAITEIVIYLYFSLRDFRNFPLRYKLLDILVLFAVVPLGIFIYIGSTRTTRTLTDNAEVQLSAAAKETAVSIDTFIENSLTDVSTLSGLHILGEYLTLSPNERPESETEQVLYQDLNAIARQNATYITSVGLMDLNGQNIADTEPSQIGEFEAEKGFFVAAIQTGQPYVSPVELDEGELSLYFSAPVHNTNNEMVGVLRIRYDASILQSLLLEAAETANVEGVVIDLLDENHIFLAITDDPESILRTVAPLPTQKLAQLQAEGRLPEGSPEGLSINQPDLEDSLNQWEQTPFFALKSEDENAAVVALQNQSWFVLAGQAQELFLAPLNDQLKSNIVIALVVATVAALLSFYISQLVGQPIINLTRVAERVAGGDLTAKATVEADDEIGRLATAFNQMTQQILNVLAGLEQRIAERTQALAATVSIGQKLASLLDQREIILEVVDQLQKEFGYYHAHIYLFDKNKETLKMMGGSGVVGKALFTAGHQITAGKGLVGRAATTNSVVLASDVAQEAGWLPNPLLPETKSEIAVPIAKGDEVLGVIDVQQNKVNGLTEVDAGLLENIANQVAVALQNAQNFTQVQRDAERQVFLAQVSNKIQSTNDMESALKVAVRELGKALNAKQSFVQIKMSEEVETH